MTNLCYLGKPAEGTALPKLFERASAEMIRTNYKVWGINVAMDPRSAPKEDVVAHDLKLIYGPLFGFRVRTDGNKIFTRYGARLHTDEWLRIRCTMTSFVCEGCKLSRGYRQQRRLMCAGQ